MDNKTTLKIWVTKDNFALIQEGTYPKAFEMTSPSDTSNYVEMTVSMETLTEWVSKHRASSKPGKNLLYG
jgi:hypothetical protein